MNSEIIGTFLFQTLLFVPMFVMASLWVDRFEMRIQSRSGRAQELPAFLFRMIREYGYETAKDLRTQRSLLLVLSFIFLWFLPFYESKSLWLYLAILPFYRFAGRLMSSSQKPLEVIEAELAQSKNLFGILLAIPFLALAHFGQVQWISIFLLPSYFLGGLMIFQLGPYLSRTASMGCVQPFSYFLWIFAAFNLVLSRQYQYSFEMALVFTTIVYVLIRFASQLFRTWSEKDLERWFIRFAFPVTAVVWVLVLVMKAAYEVGGLG